MAINDRMDDKITEEEQLRLHRWGTVEALMDCLALLEQEGRHTVTAVQADVQNADLQKAVESWLVETSSGSGASAGQAGSTGQAGSAAAAEAALNAGRQEGYGACAEWLAQGLDRSALAARLLQGVFAVWPRDGADYQRGYDAFLEKELQNPRAAYYSSSHVWMTAVDDLRTKVTCAAEQGQVLSHRIVRRAVKLLHMHPEHLAGQLAPAAPPTGARQPQSTPAKAVTPRPGHPFGAGSGAG
jgi:hypothetical protein